MITKYERLQVLREEYRNRKAEEDRELALRRKVRRRLANAYLEIERSFDDERSTMEPGCPVPADQNDC